MRAKQEQEDERNRIELEEFEKKFGKKKHKERKRHVAVEADNSYIWKTILGAASIVFLAIIIYFFILPHWTYLDCAHNKAKTPIILIFGKEC